MARRGSGTILTPFLRPIPFHQNGNEVTVAFDPETLALLLAGGPPPPPGRIVLAAGLRPHEIPELANLLAMASSWLDLGGNRYFERTAQRLQRWESGEIRLAVDGRELVLTLAMRLDQ
jgi:hypothetical protein